METEGKAICQKIFRVLAHLPRNGISSRTTRRDSQHLQLALRRRSLNFYVLLNESLYIIDWRMEMKIYGATVRFVSKRITVAELVMQVGS